MGLALDAIDAAQSDNGTHSGRHRVTHLFAVAPRDLPRFAKLGVYADVQMSPSALTDEYRDYLTSIIGSRAEHLIPAASLLEAGAPMALSSDWDADELNPLVKIVAALERNAEGLPDVETAVRLLTIEPAKLLGHAEQTGTLEVGKFADIAILDRDIFSIPVRKIGKTEVVATLLGGEAVYDPDGMFGHDNSR